MCPFEAFEVDLTVDCFSSFFWEGFPYLELQTQAYCLVARILCVSHCGRTLKYWVARSLETNDACACHGLARMDYALVVLSPFGCGSIDTLCKGALDGREQPRL